MAKAKHPPTRAIFCDVDGTLVQRGRVNVALVQYLRARRAEGFELVLWSARGGAYARQVAQLELVTLFDAIVSKPGYVIDDLGWTWTRYTRVIRSARELPPPPPRVAPAKCGAPATLRKGNAGPPPGASLAGNCGPSCL